MNKYDDIINLEHYVSKKRVPMSMENRAAQFAPFSALTGYSAAVKEKARLTENKKKLTDEEVEIINNKLNMCINHLDNEVIITYFVKDIKKIGGKYLKYRGFIKKIDIYNRRLILDNKTNILFDDILDIESDFLDK